MANIKKMVLDAGNAAPETVLTGYTFTSNTGIKREGSLNLDGKVDGENIAIVISATQPEPIAGKKILWIKEG